MLEQNDTATCICMLINIHLDILMMHEYSYQLLCLESNLFPLASYPPKHRTWYALVFPTRLGFMQHGI